MHPLLDRIGTCLRIAIFALSLMLSHAVEAGPIPAGEGDQALFATGVDGRIWIALLGALALLGASASFYKLRERRTIRRHEELAALVDQRTEKLREEIEARQRAQQRTATFSRLGQRLSLTSTPVEAANIIVETADELIGWDACNLLAYSAARNQKTVILGYDIIDGKRVSVPVEQFHTDIAPLTRKTIEEGAQLILREQPGDAPRIAPFGDESRLSASLMFTPMRNGKEVVGILSIQSYSLNAYNQADLDTLQTLADYCSGAFQRIHTEEEFRKNQPRMLHQERLAAIGELSAGAAHEFNNILTVIQGNTDLLLGNFSNLDPAMHEALQDISTGTKRAANLTRQLLTFSRKQFIHTEVLDLNQTIARVAQMLRRLLGETIEIDCRLSEDLDAIRADPGMMEQILMNLAVNSHYAMPNGGRLVIATDNVEITALHPHPEARPGKFVSLSVSDTGCGMNAATMGRLFEPFFTTKSAGEGTGLGLASAYGIAKQHQGWIEVASQIDRGTTFSIYLPATDEKPAPQRVHAPETASSGGRETILVVEDEKGVRNLIRSILSKLNYVVLEASTGAGALELWSGHQGKIDLLLTDIVLPENMSGRELAEKLRAIEPGLPVIFTSGYARDAIGPDFPLNKNSFLPKPFPPRELIDLIRRRLNDGRDLEATA